MPKKLNVQTSTHLVHSTLGQISERTSFSGDTLLGSILSEPSARHVFREKLRDNVRAEGYGIRWRGIPVEPHVTVDHIVTTLTGLAGDPGIDDEEASLPGDPGVDDESISGLGSGYEGVGVDDPEASVRKKKKKAQ